jgi:signal transduction histidine kinase
MQTEPQPAASRLTGRIREWVRRLGVPVRDPRFWVIQALVLAIDVGHTLLENAELLVGDSELYLLSVSVFLIPVVYAALSFGLRGAVPTALWALVLSFPEISAHDSTVRAGILTQFAIVLAIAVIVALRVDRERAASRATEQANRQLSRLNATASAVAGSLDLDHVLLGTLRAKLDPQKQQVAWIQLVGNDDFSGRTDIDSTQATVPTELDVEQERLTMVACLTGQLQIDDPTREAAHTVVAALKSDGRTVGAIGLTQPVEAISEDEYQVHTAMANQLSVALNNISTHEHNREALASLEAAKQNLEIYIELATEAQEEERKRLSRELHDDILQSLVVVKAQIESATSLERPELTRDRLIGAQQILADTIVDVRRYCHDLRPSLLDDLGLVDAVDWLVSDLRARTSLSVELVATGPPHRLSNRDELLIFRIVQEALHNVERHAHATHTRVTLTYEADTLGVCVTDNGRGMAQSKGRSWSKQSEPGLGLRGMEERTKLLRGQLTIRSRTGRGTELTLTVPLPATETTQVMLGS